jgi:hypothetical protein
LAKAPDQASGDQAGMIDAFAELHKVAVRLYVLSAARQVEDRLLLLARKDGAAGEPVEKAREVGLMGHVGAPHLQAKARNISQPPTPAGT